MDFPINVEMIIDLSFGKLSLSLSLSLSLFLHYQSKRRINGNKIELIEHSLIHKLDKNAKRIHFSNAFIIPNVCLTEFDKSIHLLLATSIGFYRFIFPINIKVFLTITSLFLYKHSILFQRIIKTAFFIISHQMISFNKMIKIFIKLI
jgi:hypothetical protein